MRKLLREFKSFAMSGNMLDLALGFIIGAAFAKLIESLANNVLMQLVAAIFGQQDFTELVLTVNNAKIGYGAFLTNLINFMMLAGVLFLIVKIIVWLGIGQNRIFGEKHCPYCHEQVSPTALVCKFCRHQLVDELPSLAEAEELFERQRSRRALALPKPIMNLPPLSLPPIPLPPLPRNGKQADGEQADGKQADGDRAEGAEGTPIETDGKRNGVKEPGAAD